MLTLKSKTIFFLVIFLSLFLTAYTQQGPSSGQTPASSLKFIQQINLGVPAGNAMTPRRLALNSQTGHLYFLNESLPVLKEGTGLNLYNLHTGEIEKHVSINEGDNEALDLQLDPKSGLLYALWRNRSPEITPTLSIIEEETLQPIQELPGPEAIAAGEGQLYTANTNQLLAFEVTPAGLTERQRLDLPQAAMGPMAVNSTTNRLFLARNVQGQWSLEIFEADTLSLSGSYQADGRILKILPLPQKDELFLVVALNDFQVLYRLSGAGELIDLPYELGPRFGAEGIALSQDGEQLYYSNGEFRPFEPEPGNDQEPALIGLAVADLSPISRVPLLTNFEDLVVDDSTGQAFALYPYDNFLYVVDLEAETVRIVTTAIELRDLLVDEVSGELFVSDSSNRVRRLDAETFEILAENRLAGNLLDYGFRSSFSGGELALDREQNRLYVSGRPAIILEADTLTEITVLEPGGQVIPDPTADKLYVSNCGVRILDAQTFAEMGLLPQSGRREDDFIPNPCVAYSRLDPQNQLLYSLVPNGVPGSNSGNYLYVYEVGLEPRQVFSDTNISIRYVEPDPVGQRAFVNYARVNNHRLLTLDAADPEVMSYTEQLLSLAGVTIYNPKSDRLYLSDTNFNRLLALEAEGLSVIDELILPANRGFYLADLNPATEYLYLIGSNGLLLVVSAADDGPSASAEIAEQVSKPEVRFPDRKVLALAQPEETLFARIEASLGEYSGEARLYTSSDQGQNWQDLNQNLPFLPVQTFAVAPDAEPVPTLFTSLLILGQTGSLYKSNDGGQSWQPAMKGLDDLWVDRLFISPTFREDGMIFADTAYAGLHQSSDGGENWQPLAKLDPKGLFPTSNRDSAVAFGGAGVILASQDLAEMKGIFRAVSNQEGNLSPWQQVLDISVSQLALSPDGTTALAFGTGLWYSKDGGESWQAGGTGLTGVENLQADRILFSPDFAADRTVYFFFKDFSGSASGRLFRSTDGGESWVLWLPSPGEDIFTAVTITPEGNLLLGNQQAQVIQLDPSTLNWAGEAIPPMLFPLDDLAVSPDFGRDQTLFAISKQEGLFRSGDGGQTWQLTTFPARSFGFTGERYHLAVSPDFAQDQTLYGSTGRSLHRSIDGGQSWKQLSLPQGETTGLSFQAYQVALLPDFGQTHTLLAGTPAAVYRSTDGGDTWQEVLASTGESAAVDVLSVAPDGQRAYARFGYSFNLFVSSDGGQSWQTEAGSPDNLFLVLSSDTGPEGVLSVALEYDNRLLQTGPQIPPWRPANQPPTTSLTNLSAVTYDIDGSLLIGGQGGVFRGLDNGQNWQALPTAGLPLDVPVKALRLSEADLFALLNDGRILTLPANSSDWIDISVVK